MNAQRFDFDYTTNKKFLFGLMSDCHLDSPGHDLSRFDADASYICNNNGRLLFNGDLVDAIFPTDRKRYSRAGDTKKQDAQLNELVDYSVERLKPYADYIDYFGYGNHEASIVKFNNFDIITAIQRELNKLRSKTLEPIKRGGYVGFISLYFSRGKAAVRKFVIYRDHGKGGNSPVTKGTIQLQRLYTTYDADLIWLGHSHTSIIDSASQWTIGVNPKDGKTYKKQKIGIITPGYNKCFTEQSYNDGDFYKNNFPEEKFSSPTGIGYGRLELDLTKDVIKSRLSIE